MASSSAPPPLFEAFFWIEPTKAAPAASHGLSPSHPTSTAFTSTRVVFHYPPNVSHITTPFRDIPQFCFPDLEHIRLQSAAECKAEFFTFTLTEGDGNRVYGVCMRPFFRGEGLRYDVKRRARHCLCLITRRPLYALLRAVLLQLHGLTLLDETRPGSSALAFLKALYAHDPSSLTWPSVEIGLARPFSVALPRYAGTADTTAPLLPLLQALGPDQLFLLLSAVLCERRVIFVAEDAEVLSQSVLAAASMVLPFSWQHIFIPLLPSGLLDYAQAPMPFLLGVRRNQLPQLERMGAALSDCVVVDVDQGSLRTAGRVTVVDFVGDRGGGLKQASEHVDGFVKAGASLVRGLMGGAPSREPQGPRDLMVAVLADLNRVLAQRPGADTLRGVASGLVNAAAKTLGAGGRSGTEAEAVIQWRVEGEKVLRDSLLLFFVSLFCELPEFLDRQGHLNHAAFLARRQQSGDSRELLDFLSRLRGSQMFERFCEGAGEAAGGEPEGPFQAVCRELRARRLQPTIANVKAAIAARGAARGSGGEMHVALLQYTDGRAEGPEQRQLAERVLAESSSSDVLLQVVRTLAFRLDACQAAGGRGGAGASGLRALALLRTLLLSGPQAVLSAALDFIPVLRAMLRDRKRGGLGLGAALSAIGGAIGGAGMVGAAGLALAQQQADDLRDGARETLLLLLDHQRLQHQRKFASLERAGAFPHLYAPMQRFKVQPFQDLASLHASFKPAGATLGEAPPSLRLTTPVLEAAADSAISDKTRRGSSFSPTPSNSSSAAFGPTSSLSFSPSYSSLPSAPGPAPAPTHTPTAPTPPTAIPVATYRQRMEAIYARHLPSRLPEVDALLAKYQGSEEEVLGKLESRFGREPVVVNGVTLRIPAAPPAVVRPPPAPAPQHRGDADLLALAAPAPAPENPFPVQPAAPFVHRGDIPAQFRIVDRDTGVVSDLRLMSGGGGFPAPAPAPAPTPAPLFPVLSPTLAQPPPVPFVFRGDIPPEFRIVDRDTGVVSDLRFMGGDGLGSMGAGVGVLGAPARGAMPPSWRPGMPIPAPPQQQQGPPLDPFAGLNVLRK